MSTYTCSEAMLRTLRGSLLLVLTPVLSVLLICSYSQSSQAQGGKSGGQNQGSPSSSNSAASGISVPRDEWLSKLKTTPTGGGTTFLCYRLTTLDSALVPYRIVPYPSDVTGNATPLLKDNDGKNVPCTYVDLKHPLTMDAKLVIAIDLRMFPGDQSSSPIQVDTQRIAELVYNIQVTAGTPLSPAPIRTAGTGSTLNLGARETPNVLFLAWPYELPGDSVPSLSVTVLYDPPKSGDPWTANTLYPPGSVVTANKGKVTVAHFFETDHLGQSGDTEPDWTTATGPKPFDSDCNWTWIGGAGATLPQQFQNKQKLWIAGATYQSGDIIQAPGSTQLFVMNKCMSAFAVSPSALGPPPNPTANCPVPLPATPLSQACTTGTRWDSQWNVGIKATDKPQRLTWATELPVTLDGDPKKGVLWIPSAPPVGGTCSGSLWKAGTTYGDVGPLYMCVPPSREQARNGTPERWYLVEVSGTSGSTLPTINQMGLSWTLVSDSATDCKLPGVTNPIRTWQSGFLYQNGDAVCEAPSIYKAVVSSKNGVYSGTDDPFKKYPVSISWYDAGPMPPSTVTGQLATEQTLGSLPTITLPQSHTRYSYNVASGVFVTTLRTKSFGYAPGSSISTNSGMVIQTGSSLLIDPVVSLTKYLVAFDSEKKWSPRDLIPGLSLSFSLSSPTNNFYVGGSTEFVRYLQLGCGYVAARLPQPATGVFVPSSSTTPPTTMSFHSGAYIGMTFDISGLISGMSGGGSGGSSKGGGGGGGSSSN